MFGIVINYSAVPTEAHIRDPDHLIHSPGVTSHGTSKVSCLVNRQRLLRSFFQILDLIWLWDLTLQNTKNRRCLL